MYRVNKAGEEKKNSEIEGSRLRVRVFTCACLSVRDVE